MVKNNFLLIITSVTFLIAILVGYFYFINLNKKSDPAKSFPIKEEKSSTESFDIASQEAISYLGNWTYKKDLNEYDWSIFDKDFKVGFVRKCDAKYNPRECLSLVPQYYSPTIDYKIKYSLGDLTVYETEYEVINNELDNEVVSFDAGFLFVSDEAKPRVHIVIYDVNSSYLAEFKNRMKDKMGVKELVSGCDFYTTQLELNQCSSEEAEQTATKLKEFLTKIKSIKGNEFIDQSQASWEKYRDDQCQLESSYYEGGTIQPLIRSSCLTQINFKRLVELEDFYSTLPESLSNKYFDKDGLFSFLYPDGWVVEENPYYRYPSLVICKNKCEPRPGTGMPDVQPPAIYIFINRKDPNYDDEIIIKDTKVDILKSSGVDPEIYKMVVASFK